MQNIALIDDNQEARNTFAKKLSLIFKKNYPNWNIVSMEPLIEIDDYISFIIENDICAIITDERLNDGKLSNGENVNYLGSELVKKVQNKNKNFPFICVTAYPITDELQESLNHFTYIFSRDDFNGDDDFVIKKNVNLIVKSAEKFYDENVSKLERLGELASKISSGEITDEEKKELIGIQTNLSIPHYSEIISEEEKLEKIEAKVNKLKETNEQLLKIYKDRNKE